MRIAIIGTGISGNVAAYHLNKNHDITVYEASDYIGGHTHTHKIEHAGIEHNIDSGFIVFNTKTYPNFIKLLDELGVKYENTHMSLSVKSDKTGLEYSGHSLGTLFAQRRNFFKPQFHKMILDILRFNRNAVDDLQGFNEQTCLGEYLYKGRYSQMFIEHYIVPMGAAIWSTDPALMYEFPAHFFIRFFENHGLLSVNHQPQWLVISGGSKEYLKPLTASYKDRIQLNSPIEYIRRFPTHVFVKPKNQAVERYDAVFIATHSDQALAMLADASALENDVLSAFEYQANEAVLHTDTSLLPKHKKTWAAWNYNIPKHSSDLVSVSYNMNILQNLKAAQTFCVTLNNTASIEPSKIIKKIQYDHPLFSIESIAAQKRQTEINGPERTFYCGAYWRNGFHEDGVVSALNAVTHFKIFERRMEHEQLSLRRAS